ncbi:hypothetical protein D8674_011757 [Pyrus ussuriensis x Pyrus communis]|uniref:Uncharacterized protein n=1 Tax=Pyrus ussuriensis x Pyrus communis TaxID=2448454 RepID=A0A5N5FZL9_9ROSA|nr:hypothetical protein D8674_011757 [Pyrus ussuriensis x Pyrus communis]
MTEYLLRSILHNPDASSRVSKWAIELGQHETIYCPKTSIKAQALEEVEFTLAAQDVTDSDNLLTLAAQDVTDSNEPSIPN